METTSTQNRTTPVRLFRRSPDTRAFVVVHLADQLAADRTPEAIDAAWARLTTVVDLTPHDQVLVVTGPALARVAMFRLPQGRVNFRIARGPVDAVVNAEVDLDFVSRRFDYLVIASGNKLLAPFAAAAKARDINVVQVAGANTTSRALAQVCTVRTALSFAA